MLMVVITFFVLAALMGMYLLSFVLQDKNTPKGVAFTHGPLAAIGFILLIIYAFFHVSSLLIVSILLFAFAAFGGFLLIYLDITGQSIPKWLALGHGFMAVLGFVFLLIYAFHR